jgi:hypothetical protein
MIVIFPPYPRFPYPWWMFITMLDPEVIAKYGKLALKHLQEAREKAKKKGKENRKTWNAIRNSDL